MERIKAVIIDDIPLAIASLRVDIEDNHPDVDVIGTAESVVSGLKLVKEVKPDLLFLDIQMGDGDGFDLIDILNDPAIKIIFTTASRDHAVKAFRYAAADYLLKPIDPELLANAIAKVRNALSDSLESDHVQDAPSRLVLSTHDELRLVAHSEIIRLESSGNYTFFYLEDGSKILVTRTLKEYDGVLSGTLFLRVHQSHLVNLQRVKAYVKTEGGYLLMKDGSHVPVSVRKKSYVIERLSGKEGP